ncbi:MAG: FMN-binding protein [Gemmatimonadetes bacterium]|nr:FMN-binding protein [Gemmatimonadota bacterium]
MNPAARPPGAPRPSFVAAGGALILGLACLAVSTGAAGQTLMTQEEALAAAFPAPAVTERETAFLTDAQLARARRLAGDDVPIDQGVVTYYAARRRGVPAGVAYFDAHRVRTKAEVIMVALTPDGRVDRVEVLKFTEPPEYRAPAGWIAQFDGRPLNDELSMKGGILNITGATLTARAMTRAVRRVLALHAVIDPFGTGTEK